MQQRSYHNYIAIFITLGFLISGTLCAKGEGDCELIDENNKTLLPYQWRNGIDLDAINDVQKENSILRRYKMKNVYWIEDEYNNNQAYKYYVTVDLLDDYDSDYDSDNFELIIQIGRNFKNYENEETLTTLKLRVNFECSNGKYSEIEFRIPINDSNNHSPEFLDKSYNFTLPMPVPKALFAETITLRDVDLTNKRITLNFDENEHSKERFLISSAVRDQENKKNYLAKLISSTTIDLQDDITFTLSATDSGNPPRTTNTTINIIVDKENSYPQFAHQLYTANLTEIDYKENHKIPVEFAEGNITVTRGYQGIGNFVIKECSDENKKHFKLTHSGALSEHGLVTYIELNNLTEEFLKQKVISFVLSAVRSQVEATTVVQILLPEISDEKVSNKECQTSEDTIVLNDDSTNGYMVATIVLSVISVILTISIVFIYMKKEIYRYISKIYESISVKFFVRNISSGV